MLSWSCCHLSLPLHGNEVAKPHFCGPAGPALPPLHVPGHHRAWGGVRSVTTRYAIGHGEHCSDGGNTQLDRGPWLSVPCFPSSVVSSPKFPSPLALGVLRPHSLHGMNRYHLLALVRAQACLCCPSGTWMECFKWLQKRFVSRAVWGLPPAASRVKLFSLFGGLSFAPWKTWMFLARYLWKLNDGIGIIPASCCSWWLINVYKITSGPEI